MFQASEVHQAEVSALAANLNDHVEQLTTLRGESTDRGISIWSDIAMWDGTCAALVSEYSARALVYWCVGYCGDERGFASAHEPRRQH